jgi:hypothetical protein
MSRERGCRNVLLPACPVRSRRRAASATDIDAVLLHEQRLDLRLDIVTVGMPNPYDSAGCINQECSRYTQNTGGVWRTSRRMVAGRYKVIYVLQAAGRNVATNIIDRIKADACKLHSRLPLFAAAASQVIEVRKRLLTRPAMHSPKLQIGDLLRPGQSGCRRVRNSHYFHYRRLVARF